MKKTLMPMAVTASTPATGLSSHVLATHSAHTTPNVCEQGTGLSFAAGYAAAAAQVAVFGARVIDLPGSVPRGAPV